MAVAANDGPRQLRELGLRLKALSAGGDGAAAASLGSLGTGRTLRAQLLAGIRTGASPAVAAARSAARSTLPRSGGLADYIASEKIKVAVRLAGKAVGVRITAKGGWGANRGNVRHPVFGNRNRWMQQPISTSGWFDDTLNREAPKVRLPVKTAMDAVAAEIMRRV